MSEIDGHEMCRSEIDVLRRFVKETEKKLDDTARLLTFQKNLNASLQRSVGEINVAIDILKEVYIETRNQRAYKFLVAHKIIQPEIRSNGDKD